MKVKSHELYLMEPCATGSDLAGLTKAHLLQNKSANYRQLLTNQMTTFRYNKATTKMLIAHKLDPSKLYITESFKKLIDDLTYEYALTTEETNLFIKLSNRTLIDLSTIQAVAPAGINEYKIILKDCPLIFVADGNDVQVIEEILKPAKVILDQELKTRLEVTE